MGRARSLNGQGNAKEGAGERLAERRGIWEQEQSLACTRKDCVDPDFPSTSTGLLVMGSAIEH